MKRSEVLKRAKALVDRPDGWTRYAFKRRRPDGYAYCALGAIRAAVGENGAEVRRTRRFLGRVSRELYAADVAAVNDCMGKPAVDRLFDTAICVAEQEELGVDALLEPEPPLVDGELHLAVEAGGDQV